jgi:hypothetical protein
MKTYIIQLEQHDDLISVRDKMSWAKSPRILLVWPPRRKANIRPLDLVLLNRHARILGARLGIVSRSGGIRRSAADSGIPSFSTAAEAQTGVWTVKQTAPWPGNKERTPREKLLALKEDLSPKEPALLNAPAARVWIFFAGVLSVLAILILLLPSAVIEVSPVTILQQVTIPIVVDSSAASVTLSGAIPAYTLSATVEGKDQSAATGKMTVPVARASGMVRFMNLTQSKVLIPEGTIVRTASEPFIRFFVTQSGETPEGVGASIDLPVRAAAGGSVGNLPQDSIQSIEGILGLSLSATNPEPTAGGAEALKTSASEGDRENLLRRLGDRLYAQALDEIKKQVPAGGFLIVDSLAAESQTAVFTPSPDEPGPTISLEMSQDFRAYYVTSDDLERLAALVLDSSLPAGYSSLPDTMDAIPSGTPVVGTDGKITWEITAERLAARDLDRMDIIASVMGKTPSAALKQLAAIEMSEPPKITLSPSWWLWLPSVPMRISVETVH